MKENFISLKNEEEAPEAQPLPAGMIAKGTAILGDVHTTGNLQIFGDVNGEVTASGDILLAGNVVGNVHGKNCQLCSGKLKGNLTVEEKVSMDCYSALQGEITAQSADLSGNIQGNLHISGHALLRKSLILKGDLFVETLQMEKGANVCGSAKIENTDATQANAIAQK